MIDACRTYDIPEPVFTEIGSDFRVEFFRKISVNGTVSATVKTDNAFLEKYPELQIMIDEPEITMNQLQNGYTVEEQQYTDISIN